MTWMETPLIWKAFIILVVVLIITFNAVALYRYWKAHQGTKREPDFLMAVGSGLAAVFWLTKEEVPPNWRNDFRQLVFLLDESAAGVISLPSGEKWKPGDVYRAFEKVSPHFNMVVQPGPAYILNGRKVAGHAQYRGVAIAFRDPLYRSALCHELIHFVDSKIYGFEDPYHQNWGARSTVERIVVRKVEESLQDERIKI